MLVHWEDLTEVELVLVWLLLEVARNELGIDDILHHILGVPVRRIGL